MRRLTWAADLEMWLTPVSTDAGELRIECRLHRRDVSDPRGGPEAFAPTPAGWLIAPHRVPDFCDQLLKLARAASVAKAFAP